MHSRLLNPKASELARKHSNNIFNAITRIINIEFDQRLFMFFLNWWPVFMIGILSNSNSSRLLSYFFH